MKKKLLAVDLPPIWAIDDEEIVDILPMPPLKGDKEEVTEGKGLKRLSVISAQLKAGNNSYKIKKRNQANTISFVLT